MAPKHNHPNLSGPSLQRSFLAAACKHSQLLDFLIPNGAISAGAAAGTGAGDGKSHDASTARSARPRGYSQPLVFFSPAKPSTEESDDEEAAVTEALDKEAARVAREREERRGRRSRDGPAPAQAPGAPQSGLKAPIAEAANLETARQLGLL